MTVAIVDPFEMVDIQYRQQQLAAIAFPACHFQFEALTPAGTIGQAGKWIDQGFLPLFFEVITEALRFLLHIGNLLGQALQALRHGFFVAITLLLVLANSAKQAIQAGFQ